MKLSDPSSEAEWMVETIVDDFAQSLDLSSRVQFYARLVELLTERRNESQMTLDGDDQVAAPLKKIH